MSKGEIIEHKGEGLYRVRQKLAVERIQQELVQVQARLAELAVELPTAKLDLIHADDAVRDKAQEIDALIPDYAAGADGALQQITALQTELIRLQSEAGQQRLKVAELIAEDLANRKRQNQLEQVPKGREMDLWCADYSVELTGEVGLVDINDEGGQGALIQPGFEDGATYDAARDGALFPNLAQSGPQIYLNAALLPGVQKWRPRYRVGTISNIVNDSCTVTLDDAESSAQGLNINEERILTGVPIQYMDCNGVVFESGDKVLVRFTQNGPLVVGFYEEPRPCILPGFLFSPASYTEGGSVTRYGQPITEENAPLGTAGGERPGWILHPDPESYPYLKLKGRSMTNSGQANWAGANGIHLSWQGTGNRAAIWGTYGKKVFFRLKTVFDLAEHPSFSDHVVVGAGYDGAYLHVMSYSDNVTDAGGELAHLRQPVDESLRPTGDLQTIQEIPLEPWQRPATGCYWSEDGLSAVMTLVSISYDASSGDPGKYLDANQMAWELSILSSGSNSVVPIYDSVENSNAAIVSQTTTNTTASIEVSERLIPIYVDYDGNQKVTAYWREPGVIGSAEFSETETAEKKTKTDSRTYACTGPAAVIIGTSEVIAQNETTSAWSSNYFWERTYVEGGTDQLVYSGEMVGTDNLTDLGYIHEAIVCIDARTRTVILAENKNDWDMAWDFSGDWQGPFNEFYSGDPIPAGSRVSTVDALGQHDGFLRWRLSAWVAGTKVAELTDRAAVTFAETVYQREPGAGGISNYGPLMAPVGGNPFGSSSYGGPLQFGSAGMQGDRALSLLHERYDETVAALFWVSKISEPAAELFGQSPGDPFFFDELTLV